MMEEYFEDQRRIAPSDFPSGIKTGHGNYMACKYFKFIAPQYGSGNVFLFFTYSILCDIQG